VCASKGRSRHLQTSSVQSSASPAMGRSGPSCSCGYLPVSAGGARAVGSSTTGLTTARVGEFFAERKARVKVARVPSRMTGPLVAFLRAEGLLDAPTEPPGNAVDELLVQFRRHLVTERGLRENTVDLYSHTVRTFLRSLEPDFDLGDLGAEQVTRFVLSEAERRSPASATSIVVGLRSFLRYAFVEGLVARRLDTAVPTVANWRASALPKALEPGVARRLLKYGRSRAGHGAVGQPSTKHLSFRPEFRPMKPYKRPQGGDFGR
jgi:hypothetical protein